LPVTLFFHRRNFPGGTFLGGIFLGGIFLAPPRHRKSAFLAVTLLEGILMQMFPAIVGS